MTRARAQNAALADGGAKKVCCLHWLVCRLTRVALLRGSFF